MKVLLSTLHAKYVHSSLALPCLAAACCGVDGVDVAIREFTINEPHEQTLRALYASRADIVAFSCYIWNIEATLRLASDLKKIRPETLVVLGGPEVSFGVFELMERNPAVDCVVRGEGEETFCELIDALARSGNRGEALGRMTAGISFRDGDDIVALTERDAISALDSVPSPFAADLVDLGKPLVYFETSRGCPFSCAFCMSSLEKGVRSFSPERIEHDLLLLMDRRVKNIKLVDRTFNYDAARADRIWEFILRHNQDSSFHFEIAADLLTDGNIELLRRVPADTFRFEIGVQSENEATLQRVGRKSDLRRLFANVDRLRRETGVILHLDLVAGLPHEDFSGFLDSLQTLFDAAPHHIQVEPLKVLKGSPMRRIAMEEEYSFSGSPPYKILTTPWLSFDDICRIETIARLIDLYYNSGKFDASLKVLGSWMPLNRIFDEFAGYWEKENIPAGISQQGLFEVLWRFVSAAADTGAAEDVRDALCFDYCRAEYPVPGRFPAFFPEEPAWPGEKPRDAIDAAIRTAPIPKGSRVRTFLGRFCRDYRNEPWSHEPVYLLFLYVASPGRKMEVHILQFYPPDDLRK